MTRAELIRQRARRADRAEGRPSYVSPYEAKAIKLSVLAGTPTEAVAAAHGLTLKRVERIVRDVVREQRQSRERRAVLLGEVTLVCPVCMESYKYAQSRGRSRKTCSRACAGRSQGRGYAGRAKGENAAPGAGEEV